VPGARVGGPPFLISQEAHMLRRFVFVVVAAVLAATPAFAQDERPIQLTIGGGFTGVYGAGADRLGNGGNFTLGVLFHTKSPISFQAEYGWNGMKQKQLVLPVFGVVNPLEGETGTPTDFFLDSNMQYGSANAIFSPKTDGRVAPYGLVGAGVYYRPVTVSTPGVGYTSVCDPYWYVCYPTLVSVENVVGSRSSTDFGMNFGGGVNFRMTDHASIFFEIRYHYIWGPTFEGAQVNPLITGSSASTATKANGQFLPITIGFRF
jgi:opacity protein-like surface antigen